MTSKIFKDFSKPPIDAAWLNDVNKFVYEDGISSEQLALPTGAGGVGSVLSATGSVPMTLAEQLSLRFNVWNFLTAAERLDASTGAPVIDTTAKIQLANDRAKLAGRPLDAIGTFRIGAQKLTITTDCDLSSAVFLVYGAPTIAGEVSTGSSANPTDILVNRVVRLPRRTVNMTKPSVGWAGQGTGWRTVNLNTCTVYTGNIVGFAKSLQVAAYGDNGNVYNDYFIGHLENGQINAELFVGDSGSWVNENNFYGGRYSHYTAEGVNVSGVRHIVLRKADNKVNNNLFIKPSIEGNVAEFHVENSGAYNTFQQARWEATPPKVWYNADNSNQATRNLIIGGYTAQSIVFTNTGPIGINRLIAPGTDIDNTSTGRRVANQASSFDPIDAYYDAGTDVANAGAADWSVIHSARSLRGKQKADAFERIRVDYAAGLVWFGAGTALPTSSFGRVGSLIGPNVSLIPAANGTLELGLTSLRWSATWTNKLFLTLGAAPAAANSIGVVDEVRVTSDYIYVCVATNTWKRAALTTW